MKSINQRIHEVLITYCVCDFFFHGYSCKPAKPTFRVPIPGIKATIIHVFLKLSLMFISPYFGHLIRFYDISVDNTL